MIAKIRIAKNRRRPICSRGIIAFMIDFRTTCKPAETRERPACEQRPYQVPPTEPTMRLTKREWSTPIPPRKAFLVIKLLEVLIIYCEEF